MTEAYVAVRASRADDNSVPSGHDTTSGYYITYIPTEEGGYTGTGWYLTGPYSEMQPFYEYTGTDGMLVETAQDILDVYESKTPPNLNEVFSTWISRVGDRNVHDFCHMLYDTEAYDLGCIRMVG